MRPADLITIGAVLVLLVVAGFMAMAETGLTRMSRVKALTLVDERRRGAGVLLDLVEHPESFLTSVLYLVMLTHLVIATLIGLITERYGAAGVAAGLLLESVAIFTVAEAAPKTYAIQHTERAALLVAPVVSGVVRFPLTRLISRALISLSNVFAPGRGIRQGPFVSEQELLAMTDVAAEEEVIEHEERALIRSIIEFGDTVVREVMVPRPDMVAVEGRDRAGDVMEVAIAAGYSRIPVYDQGIDDIAGIVYTKDLMRAARDGVASQPVRGLVRDAHFVPETKRVAELMKEMQAEKFHMAVVIDEYGGTAGLVTLEDLIEELVGEIVDEFDVEEPSVEALPGGSWRVNARMGVDEVNELLSSELPSGDWDTIGGLVFNLLGHVPAEGETVECDGHRLAAEKIQGRRIGRVRITRVDGPGRDSLAAGAPDAA